jgi:hypothetical protein
MKTGGVEEGRVWCYPAHDGTGNRPSMRARAFAFSLLIPPLLLSNFSFGICPSPTPRACSLYHRSKAVFIGTVLREDYHEFKDRDAERTYTLRVIRSFRGPKSRTIKVFTMVGSAGEYLDKGKTYLVFARASDGGRFAIFCMDTQEVKDVEAAARRIEAEQRQNGPVTIQGEVQQYEGEKRVGPDEVEVRGPSGTMKLRTDGNGRFKVRVPPGKYDVIVRGADGRPFQRSIYTWDAAPDEYLEPGQCVHLIFEPGYPPKR